MADPSCGRAIFLLYLLLNLFAQDADFPGRADPHPHLAPADLNHRNNDVVADGDTFPGPARENQHGRLAEKIDEARSYDLGGRLKGCLKSLLKTNKIGINGQHIRILDF